MPQANARRGPATVVEGIADAAAFAEAVIGAPHSYDIPAAAHVTAAGRCREEGRARRRGLSLPRGRALPAVPDGLRKLRGLLPEPREWSPSPCRTGRRQVIHVDRMCNECGNCTQFCPYASEPCHDKFTLFQTKEDMDESENYGVLFEDDDMVRLRYEDGVKEYDLASCDNDLPVELEALILTVRDKYSYLYA